MRQAAEDVSAHSAVKEGSIGPISYVRNKWQKFRLRSAAEEVAKKNFPEEERQNLTEAVVKAFKSGELDKRLERNVLGRKAKILAHNNAANARFEEFEECSRGGGKEELP